MLGGWKISMNDAARRAPPRALRGTQYVLRHVLRQVLRHVLHVLVLHESPKGSVGGGARVLGVEFPAAGRWRVPRRTPPSSRPSRRPACPPPHPAPRPSRAAWGAERVGWAWVPPLDDAKERRGTKSTVKRPSRHPIRPPPRPAPSPTPPFTCSSFTCRQSARKVSREPSLGCRTNSGFRTFKEVMKKPFAWVSKGALGTKLARPGAQDCLP